MEQLKLLINKLKNSPNKIRIAMVMGIAGMILIMISEIIPDKKRTPEPESKSETTSDEADTFRKSTENELRSLLEKIEGVGECEVMVSVEGTTEYVYAQNISRYTDEDADRKSDKLDENIVIIENSSGRQALVRRVIRPQISGVVVVCEGGGDIRVNERVLKAVSTALNISSGRVCVESKSK